MRNLFTTVIFMFALASQTMQAQTGKQPLNPWNYISEAGLASKSQSRQIIPQQYKTLKLNVSQMKTVLNESPMWHTPEADKKEVILTLPMPNGTYEHFRIVEAPVMHPDLAAQFPMIHSYAGTGIEDPTAYIRFDLTQRGFHAFVRSGQHSDVFVDPYSTADVEHYISYYKKDFQKDGNWQCSADEVNKKQDKAPSLGLEKAGDCTLRTYSLALACTGEYAAFHGGTVALVMAAMNTSMTRVNGVFEIDAAVHMNLVANNNSLIYLNAATDPYTNNDGGTMLDQNQTTCDNIIGNANYDIGHVFSTGGGGVAYLGAVCSSNIKAGGVTGSGSPVNDAFDIDYVAHEMGHQFGANHTQNNACNRNNPTAMEPGSASTIMGYAGICSPDVQAHSDAYFHAISLQEIAAEVTSGNNGGTGGGGNVCSTNSTPNNSAPTAGAGADYTIPKSNAFVLTGSGSDTNTPGLTYCWEQMDNAVASMPPSPTNTGGPAFRSLSPAASNQRYFPNLASIIAGTTPTWEVLPSVGRTFNFRLTVRDNQAGAGCTKEDNAVITVAGNSGPLLVTVPSLTGINWPAQSQQTITWNVAGTTAAPVSCANVDILLSLDGGNTYTITLAAATPNDGTQLITLPSNTSTMARVMVKGSGNIFFDISDNNFTLSTPVNDFTVDASPNSQTICLPANAVYSVVAVASGSFTGNVTLSATGVPAGATATFSANPVAPGITSQLTLANVPAGTYSITVNGVGSTGTRSETVTLTAVNGAPGTVTLTSPANGATGVSTSPALTWASTPDATSYDMQVATDATFATIVASATSITATTFTPASPLATNTLHYWRVRGKNSCATGAYSAAFTFTTLNTTCATFASTNVPVTISASGTPTVTSTLTLGATGNITDINLTNLNITHTYIDDLIVKLKGPSGTEITLLNRICTSQDNIITNLDDEAANTYSSIPCPPVSNSTYQPFQALSAFDGQSLTGTWTLTIQDMANDDGGTLNSWSLNICYAATTPPVTVTATGTNVSCFGGNNGSATATATGGTGSYTYAWSNGPATQTITGLAAGTYTVTATSGASSATASYTVTQPAAPLTLNVTGVNPTSGNNGSATATATGGTPPYTYFWNTNATTASITGLAAGNYTVTTTDNKGCTATGSVTLTAPPPPSLKFEYGVATAVGNSFQTVTLTNTYASMVVVTSLVMPTGETKSYVTRIQNATGNTFQVKVQDASSATGAVTPLSVHYMVAEEGIYTQAAHGVKFEAKKVTSTLTSSYVNWVFEARTYSNAYTNPVVVGQVMTYNDPKFSAFWSSRSNSRVNPPNATSFAAGKHIAEDNVNTTRANETLGYFVFESGAGTINGKRYAAGVGANMVQGYTNNTAGFSYPLSGFASVNAAVVSSAAQNATEGAWAVLATTAPLSITEVKTWAMEDRILDVERGHAVEQHAYLVIGNATTLRPEQPATSTTWCTAYPNPASAELTVDMNLAEGGPATLTVLDLLGKTLLTQQTIVNENGYQQVKLDVSQLSPGSYFLELVHGGLRQHLQFVKTAR